MRRKEDQHLRAASAASSTPRSAAAPIYAARPAHCRSYPGGRCGYYDFLSFERAAQEDPEFVATTWNK